MTTLHAHHRAEHRLFVYEEGDSCGRPLPQPTLVESSVEDTVLAVTRAGGGRGGPASGARAPGA